jgi:hypothetical protein
LVLVVREELREVAERRERIQSFLLLRLLVVVVEVRIQHPLAGTGVQEAAAERMRLLRQVVVRLPHLGKEMRVAVMETSSQFRILRVAEADLGQREVMRLLTTSPVMEGRVRQTALQEQVLLTLAGEGVRFIRRQVLEVLAVRAEVETVVMDRGLRQPDLRIPEEVAGEQRMVERAQMVAPAS